jgi:hypothetical protein
MTPTPRTDAAIAVSDGQWSFVLRDLAQELERELAESTESLDFQTQLNREVIELEKKTLGERNDAREELASLKATIADPDEVELAMIRGEIAIPDRAEFDVIRNTPVGYNL